MRIIIYSVVALALIVAARIFLPFELPPIRVAAEPLPGLVIPGFNIPVTNSLFTAWLTMLVLVLFAVIVTRGMQTVPTGKQNIAEMLIEAMYGLVEGIAGPKWSPTFFPIVMTIFLFVLVSNWLDVLTPVLAAVGFQEHVGDKIEIIPILRSPSTDLNFTVGLALISVALTQYFGIRSNGFLGYGAKFIKVAWIGDLIAVIQKKKPGSPGMVLMLGMIDLFMGLIELVSEVAKILSFSFRLFGNIFAGEVLLLVIPFLLSFLVPLIFMGLETFVGLIQAFIFAILTLAFMSTAVASHGHADEEKHEIKAPGAPETAHV